jgi:hypothetical protein
VNGQFVDLFDSKKFGFNFKALLAMTAGGFIGSLLYSIWLFFENLIRSGHFFFPLDRFVWLSLLSSLVAAALFVGLAHALSRDIWLPVCVGLGMVAWGFIDRGARLISEAHVFNLPSVAVNFLWIFATAFFVILFYRSLGRRLVSFLAGFAAAEFVMSLLALAIYRYPLRFLPQMLILNTVGGFVTGWLFYLALAHHLKWRKPVSSAWSEKAGPLTELPAIPRFFSRRNFSLGWSFQWRMAIAWVAIFAFLSMLLAVLPESLRRVLFFERSRFDTGGGTQLVTYGFILSPLLVLFFINWVAKATLQVRYGLATSRFIGWSVWWRAVALNLGGLLPLGVLALLMAGVGGGEFEGATGTIFGGLVFLYLLAWIPFSLYVSGWALHSVFGVYPLENWRRSGEQGIRVPGEPSPPA